MTDETELNRRIVRVWNETALRWELWHQHPDRNPFRGAQAQHWRDAHYIGPEAAKGTRETTPTDPKEE